MSTIDAASATASCTPQKQRFMVRLTCPFHVSPHALGTARESHKLMSSAHLLFKKMFGSFSGSFDAWWNVVVVQWWLVPGHYMRLAGRWSWASFRENDGVKVAAVEDLSSQNESAESRMKSPDLEIFAWPFTTKVCCCAPIGSTTVCSTDTDSSWMGNASVARFEKSQMKTFIGHGTSILNFEVTKIFIKFVVYPTGYIWAFSARGLNSCIHLLSPQCQRA